MLRDIERVKAEMSESIHANNPLKGFNIEEYRKHIRMKVAEYMKPNMVS
jgi:hypothetical protein